MKDLAAKTATELRLGREDLLFGASLTVAIFSWTALAVSIIALNGLAFVALPLTAAILIAVGCVVVVSFVFLGGPRLLLAHACSNGLAISAAQTPKLHAQLVAAADRLGVREVPDAYLLPIRGWRDALAARLFAHTYLLLDPALVNACGEDRRALDFILGHSMGQFALGHRRRQPWLEPARWVPWLGAAYSRACELSCDRCGLLAAQDLEAATRGLVILATRGAILLALTCESVPVRGDQPRGFWSSMIETHARRPSLLERVQAMGEFVEPSAKPAPPASVLAFILAPLFHLPVVGVLMSSGAVVGLLVATIVVATIALSPLRNMLSELPIGLGLPPIADASVRGQNVPPARGVASAPADSVGDAGQDEAKMLLLKCQEAQHAFHEKNQRYGTSFEELALTFPEPPQKYSLYMGGNQIGPDRVLASEDYRGYAIAHEGYACFAVGDADENGKSDVWMVTSTQESPARVAGRIAPVVGKPPPVEDAEEGNPAP